jgi:cytochrome c2
MTEGVLLAFDVPVDVRSGTDPANFSLASWSYRRTPAYGSAQYRADGTTGVDWLQTTSAYVSRDRRKVFVGARGLGPVMQMRIGWSIRSETGAPLEGNAYTTPHALVAFDPEREGFAPMQVSLAPRTAVARTEPAASVDEGRRLAQVLGCVACHSLQDQDQTRIGPKWRGLYGSERSYVGADRQTGVVIADETYLRESILDPAAKKVAGFERGEYAMPSYAGAVTETQVESLVMYLRSLR